MKFLQGLFEKKYLEWDNYIDMMDNMELKELKERVKENNEKVRKEIFKNMNFSG
jgi:hypothetical protein